jgi:hypothetical protein
MGRSLLGSIYVTNQSLVGRFKSRAIMDFGSAKLASWFNQANRAEFRSPPFYTLVVAQLCKTTGAKGTYGKIGHGLTRIPATTIATSYYFTNTYVTKRP